MRRTRLLRGLSALFLALYAGVGSGVPVVDAVAFHHGRAAETLPAAGGERPAPGIHEVCLLGLHTFPALPDAVAVAGPSTQHPHAGPTGLSEAAPRDAVPAGLPPSRAPPLA
jgi:hypothetical protein